MPATTLDARPLTLRSRRSGASDEQLARAAGRGDVGAFEALYERHHLPLLSFSRHMLGRAHDAEDVVQHSFLAADRAFRAGKVPKAVRAWLYTVARNRCVSVLRTRREDAGLPDVGIPSTENLVADVEQREDLRELLADLRALPDDQRAALLLAELGDLTHTEVGKVIGVRAGKVKALVFQARESLMASAKARAIPCQSIREELASATGAALRRRHLRNHLAQCEGCRDYGDAVRAQRAALGALLPVVPTLALRDGVLSGLSFGGAAAGTGAGVGAGLLAKSTAAKLLTTIAVGGAAAGGGVAVKATVDTAPASRTPEQRQGETVGGGAAPAAGAERPAGPAAPAVSGSARTLPTLPRKERAARVGKRRANRRADAPGRGRRERAAAPGQARKEGAAPPPGQARSEGRAPPGQARRDGGDPPGRARADSIANRPKARAPKVTPERTRPAKAAEPARGRSEQAPRAVKPAAEEPALAPATGTVPDITNGKARREADALADG